MYETGEGDGGFFCIIKQRKKEVCIGFVLIPFNKTEHQRCDTCILACRRSLLPFFFFFACGLCGGDFCFCRPSHMHELSWQTCAYTFPVCICRHSSRVNYSVILSSPFSPWNPSLTLSMFPFCLTYFLTSPHLPFVLLRSLYV